MSSDDAQRRAQLERWPCGASGRHPAGCNERIGAQPDRRDRAATTKKAAPNSHGPLYRSRPEPHLPACSVGPIIKGQRPRRTSRRTRCDSSPDCARRARRGRSPRSGEEVRSLAVPEHEQPDQEDRQRRALDADHGDQPAGRRQAVAEHQPGTSAANLHPSRQELRHQRRAHRDHRRRRAGPRCVLSEQVLDHEGADRDRRRQRGAPTTWPDASARSVRRCSSTRAEPSIAAGGRRHRSLVRPVIRTSVAHRRQRRRARKANPYTSKLRALDSPLAPANVSTGSPITTESNPACSSVGRQPAWGSPPALQPVHRSTSRIASAGTGRPLAMSANCSTLPVVGTRWISSNTARLSAHRLITLGTVPRPS